MKKTLLLLTALVLAACGDTDAPADTADLSDTPVEVATAESADDAPEADAPAEAPPAPAAPALTPADVSPDEPVDVVALRDVVFASHGQTLTVSGYLHTNMSFATTPFRNFTLTAEPGPADDSAQRVQCAQATATTEQASPTQRIVVRGTVGRPYPISSVPGEAVLTLDDCAVVSIDAEAPIDALDAQEAFDAMLGWVGREVAVRGRYNGQVSSSATNSTVVRLQAQGSEGLGSEIVGCRLADGVETPESVRQQREGVVMRGRIAPAVDWRLGDDGRLLLEGCTFATS